LRYDLANFPRIVGDLAESYDLSPDRKSVTFRLRPGVRFHDGSTLTSADVKATYERLRNPPAGVVSIRQAHFEDITTIDTPDALTVRFDLRRPNDAILHVFASPWNCVYSSRLMAADPNYPMRVVMGTGPFRFVERRCDDFGSGRAATIRRHEPLSSTRTSTVRRRLAPWLALAGLGVAAALMAGLKAIVLWFPRDRIAFVNGGMIMLGSLGAVTATAPPDTTGQSGMTPPGRTPTRR
jgi:hypothetical protein